MNWGEILKQLMIMAGAEAAGEIMHTVLESGTQYSVKKITEEMQKRGIQFDEDTFTGILLSNAQENLGASAYRAVNSISIVGTAKIIAPIEKRAEDRRDKIKKEVADIKRNGLKNKIGQGYAVADGETKIKENKKAEKEAMEARLKIFDTSSRIANNNIVGASKINDSVNGKVANQKQEIINVDMRGLKEVVNELINGKAY